VRQQSMVAVCDILGFSKLVENRTLDEVVGGALGWLRKALHHSVHKREFPTEIPSREEFFGDVHVGVAWFSDTILLYSREDSDEAVRNLILTVGWLLFETILGGFTRIRSGISYGEVYIDDKDAVFVGKPIVEAYRLEQRQQWSGAALTERASERIPQQVRHGQYADWWVVPYEIPVKDDPVLRTLAVNWTWGLHHPDQLLRWSPTADVPTESDWESRPDVCEKFINTKVFHDRLCHQCTVR
jgi:hypothetical protein